MQISSCRCKPWLGVNWLKHWHVPYTSVFDWKEGSKKKGCLKKNCNTNETGKRGHWQVEIGKSEISFCKKAMVASLFKFKFKVCLCILMYASYYASGCLLWPIENIDDRTNSTLITWWSIGRAWECKHATSKFEEACQSRCESPQFPHPSLCYKNDGRTTAS